ncbi:MAG: A/G-specific adenine glycosylase [Bacteroidetes bacterium]|nr:A/G-specific adenine glycosylase [Bacteroidota bacterium]
METIFTQALLEWHQQAKLRTLPWKKVNDPYKIWLSEIILQQTRAEQGIPYYLKFIQQYPNIHALAAANDDEVFRLWQGLGYYTRCRNLLATARLIATELGGIFPNTYADIRALRGIGDYTAAAIASFAFGLPHAVLDGNVYRVLARYYADEHPIDTLQGKKHFQKLADEVLDKKNPATFNQAIMDLGASICSPRKPQCSLCPLSNTCNSKNSELLKILPLKSKKIVVQHRYFNFILLECRDKIWLERRETKDIWNGLYQPFLIETDKDLNDIALHKNAAYQGLQLSGTATIVAQTRQRLSHQLVHSKLYFKHCKQPPSLPPCGSWLHKDTIKSLPFPKTILELFEKKGIFNAIGTSRNI